MSVDKNEFFNAYYSKYFNQLKFYAYSVLRNWKQAEEATQDVFHIAWEKIDSFRDSPNPMGWLTNTMKFTLKNIKRAENTRMKYLISLSELGDVQATNQCDPAQNLEHDFEDECAEVLSAEEYYILRRSVLDRATYQEIAGELDISLWACQKRMQRLMKKLREHFEK